MWGTDGSDVEDPWLLVVTDQGSPARRHSAEISHRSAGEEATRPQIILGTGEA